VGECKGRYFVDARLVALRMAEERGSHACRAYSGREGSGLVGLLFVQRGPISTLALEAR
jgi:hypothetical protein